MKPLTTKFWIALTFAALAASGCAENRTREISDLQRAFRVGYENGSLAESALTNHCRRLEPTKDHTACVELLYGSELEGRIIGKEYPDMMTDPTDSEIKAAVKTHKGLGK